MPTHCLRLDQVLLSLGYSLTTSKKKSSSRHFRLNRVRMMLKSCGRKNQTAQGGGSSLIARCHTGSFGTANDRTYSKWRGTLAGDGFTAAGVLKFQGFCMQLQALGHSQGAGAAVQIAAQNRVANFTAVDS